MVLAPKPPQGADGRPELLKRPVAPYIVPVPEFGTPESQPDVVRLHPYLADPDPRVRRAAVTALTETVPPGGAESRSPKRRAISPAPSGTPP